MHRIATSGHYKASLVEIESQWTFADILSAHYVIDAKERLERASHASSER